MNFCPLCTEALYLDPDEPHLLRCILRFGVWVRVVAGEPWRWWGKR